MVYGQDEEDGSSDDSNSDSDSEEDDIVDGEDSEFKLGPGQKMKTKHKGEESGGMPDVSILSLIPYISEMCHLYTSTVQSDKDDYYSALL